MDYALGLLNEKLDQLDRAYKKIVINGTVKKSSWVAIENRNMVAGLEKAIKILTEAETIKANLNIGSVSKQRELLKGLFTWLDKEQYYRDPYTDIKINDFLKTL